MKFEDLPLVSRRTLMRNGFLVVASCSCAPWTSRALPSLETGQDADPDGQSWTIGNDLVARTISFVPGRGSLLIG